MTPMVENGTVRFGLFGINLNVLATDPAAAVRVAVAAEQRGWESVWTGEHYVLPDPRAAPSPERPDTAILDPFVALTNVAAHTTTLLLGTGLTVVPMHQPLVLAKKVASVDRVSGGRLQFGVGVGYLHQEFEALGVPMTARGERFDEYLEALLAIWTQAPAAYAGRHVRFANVRAEPRPDTLPPLHFGGGVAATFRRTVTKGRGWFGFALDFAATEQAIAGLRRAEQAYARPPELGPLEISVTPHPELPFDAGAIAKFAELGVTRLIPMPPRAFRHDPDRIVEFVHDASALFYAGG
jgi:probable F420-dependent oxidoreductase